MKPESGCEIGKRDIFRYHPKLAEPPAKSLPQPIRGPASAPHSFRGMQNDQRDLHFRAFPRFSALSCARNGKQCRGAGRCVAGGPFASALEATIAVHWRA